MNNERKSRKIVDGVFFNAFFAKEIFTRESLFSAQHLFLYCRKQAEGIKMEMHGSEAFERRNGSSRLQR